MNINIVCLLFDRITTLDAIGPCEVLGRLPGVRLTYAAPTAGEVRSGDRTLGLVADASLEQVAGCDVLLVPGGFGARALMGDARVLDWIRAIDRTTTITASVCTGALLLGAAGLLAGRRATTHWAYHERLAQQGATPVAERIVRDGKYATAAGVSAGIDLALTLALELAGPEVAATIQLAIEYDPAPPLDAGNAARAPAARRERVLARIRAAEQEAPRS